MHFGPSDPFGCHITLNYELGVPRGHFAYKTEPLCQSPKPCLFVKSHYAAALDLIQAGRIRVREMTTHRLGLVETGLGFQLVGRAHDSLKVIIEPQK
jgi:hypothetical protein